MTPDEDSDADDLYEQLTRVLDEADSHLSSMDGDDDSRAQAGEELRDLGERADELLSSNDPKAVLDTIDSQGESTEPESESLAVAMAESDPESVVDLRTLLTLSKLPDADDETFSEHVEQLRELRQVSADSSREADEDEAAEGEVSEGEATDAETDDESAEDAESGVAAETESDSEVTAEADSEADGETESAEASEADEVPDQSEQIRAKLQEGLDNFRTGLQSYRDSLDDEDDEEADTDESESTSLGGDESSRRRLGTMFSTMPSRNRVGIRGTTRFSTMRPTKRRSDRK